MSEILSFHCTFLNPGYRLQQPPDPKAPVSTPPDISELWVDDPNADHGFELDEEGWVYDPAAEERGDDSFFQLGDWGCDWNWNAEKNCWIDPIVKEQVFLIRPPEHISSGVILPEIYDGYILETFNEDRHAEIDNIYHALYKEAKKRLEPLITVPKLEEEGLFLRQNPHLVDLTKTPFIHVFLLTRWKAWSSQDYYGEWDGGIELQEFLDI